MIEEKTSKFLKIQQKNIDLTRFDHCTDWVIVLTWRKTECAFGDTVFELVKLGDYLELLLDEWELAELFGLLPFAVWLLFDDVEAIDPANDPIFPKDIKVLIKLLSPSLKK